MIAIVDYGVGNLGSVESMLKRLGKNVQITNRIKDIEDATHIILPGVGSFDFGMKQLVSTGLLSIIEKRIFSDNIPALGICLGMQLMTKGSEEGTEKGLGWFDAETVYIGKEKKVKLPHMGWAYITVHRSNPLVSQTEKSRYYFVHSYKVVCTDKKDIIATCDYNGEICAVIQKGNLFGAQFHPEKSLRFGLNFLNNFSSL